jgi:hypothetical protein
MIGKLTIAHDPSFLNTGTFIMLIHIFVRQGWPRHIATIAQLTDKIRENLWKTLDI